MKIETVKAPITESEKKLLDIISKSADRIATFAHFGQREFTIEDVLSELDCDLHDIKRLIRDSAAEILKEKSNISAVEVSDLDLPFQPDITVTIKEEQDMTADGSTSGPSF
ncbi:MAG: hypothetical protein IKP78_08710 [Ruminococcus sp.]|nr:hypothetical protein [Ruminococcus sp.]MBR6985476.1 hypothetical protein [Ruminococcus sp.]